LVVIRDRAVVRDDAEQPAVASVAANAQVPTIDARPSMVWILTH
jgi:hypothetical protein